PNEPAWLGLACQLISTIRAEPSRKKSGSARAGGNPSQAGLSEL
ncbi:2410_t:CDS:1, partial [Funneliformis caledonium]